MGWGAGFWGAGFAAAERLASWVPSSTLAKEFAGDDEDRAAPDCAEGVEAEVTSRGTP